MKLVVTVVPESAKQLLWARIVARFDSSGRDAETIGSATSIANQNNTTSLG